MYYFVVCPVDPYVRRNAEHKRIALHVVFGMRRSICALMVRQASSAALHKSSLLVPLRYTSNEPHKKLSEVVRSVISDGLLCGARDVGEPRPFQRAGRCSFKTSLRKGELCVAPSYGSLVSELRFEPRLQHCRMRCLVRDFI